MLTIICGEDSVASRNYLNELLDQYKKKNFEIQKIRIDHVRNILAESSESLSLFGQKKIFVAENLSKEIQKQNSSLQKLLAQIHILKEKELIDWEDGISRRELKLKDIGTVKEFKPQKNIFQLLNACYPSNLATFLALLNSVSTVQNASFAYIMLSRHIRNLLLAKHGVQPGELQAWQIQKLRQQAAHWNKENLISFYNKLLSVEIAQKTGKAVYGLKNSIEMLACYYLA